MVSIDKKISKYAIENILPCKAGMYDFLDINNVFIKELKNLPSYSSIKVTAEIKGRLDVVSFDAYGTTDLWWIIAVYNNIVDMKNINLIVIKLPSIYDIDKLILDKV